MVKDLYYTAKNSDVATSLLTTGSSILDPTDLLQVVFTDFSILETTTSRKSVVNYRIAACYKFFQQVVTSLQMTSCDKPDFDLMKLANLLQLLTSCNKPVKLKTCNKPYSVFGCVQVIHSK